VQKPTEKKTFSVGFCFLIEESHFLSFALKRAQFLLFNKPGGAYND
jgi:hypothetical protein